jgi:RNA polymerase-binding transcription factor DksA
MNTNKAAYWIILGVLALELNSEYGRGNFVPLQRVAERAHSAFCWVSTRAQRTLEAAAILTNRGRFATNDLLASNEGKEMARAQTEALREQVLDEAELLRERVHDRVKENVSDDVRDAMRAHAKIQRAEIERIQLRARSDFKLVRTADRRILGICPKTGTQIFVNPGAKSGNTSADVDSADIELQENF